MTASLCPPYVKVVGQIDCRSWVYLQSLFEQLWETFDLQLITKLRKNRKNRLMPLRDKLLLRKPTMIKSVVDQIKNISQIEHTRHRSPINAFVNIIAGLIAHCHQPKKPSLSLFPSGLLMV